MESNRPICVVAGVARQMNDEEYAVWLRDQEAAKLEREELARKDAIRQSALNKLIDLGLTEEEIAAL